MDAPAAKRPRTEEGEENVVDLDAILQEAGDIQAEIEKLNEEASDKVLEVETEYNKKRRPHYDSRGAKLRSIPNIWRDVLLFHPILGPYFTSADRVPLDYLEEVDVQEFPDIKSGFSVHFKFSPDNPCFTNAELKKELRYNDEGTLEIIGTEIAWQPSWGPTDEPLNHHGHKRVASPDRDYNFFASWFQSQVGDPGEEGLQSDEFADVLKDEVWPDPLRWWMLAADEEEQGGDWARGEGEPFNDAPECSDEGDLDEDEAEDQEGDDEDEGYQEEEGVAYGYAQEGLEGPGADEGDGLEGLGGGEGYEYA